MKAFALGVAAALLAGVLLELGRRYVFPKLGGEPEK